MAYARTHNFANDTVLIAGTGTTVPAAGLSDEIALAHAEGMAIEPSQFADGSLAANALATPNNVYTAHFGHGQSWRPSRYRAAMDVLGYRQERVLATVAPRVDFKLHKLEIGMSDWNVNAYACMALILGGIPAPHVVLRVRVNGQRGLRVCRDLSLADFRVRPIQTATSAYDELDSFSAALEQQTTKYVLRVGSEDGDVPLLVNEFAAGDRITVAASWRPFFLRDNDTHNSSSSLAGGLGTVDGYCTELEAAYLNSPSVTFWLSNPFKLV